MYGVGHLTAAHELMKSFSESDEGDETTVESLQRRLDRQNLGIQTLLAMLLDKGVIQEDDFREWVKRMDQLDGALDGRLAEDKTKVACLSCGKSNFKTTAECKHCGAALDPDLVPPRP